MRRFGQRTGAQDIVCAVRNNGFSDNHSIAYCLLGYLCAYYRYYYPVQFITAFLNNAANDDDVSNGTNLAKLYGIRVTSPRFGVSRSDYSFDAEERIIAKGLSSIKHIGAKQAEAVYRLSVSQSFSCFTDLLCALKDIGVDERQLDILIHIDYFSMFGNQRELDDIVFFWKLFKKGDAKQIRKDKIAGSYIEEIVASISNGKTKSGAESASYALGDVMGIIRSCEKRVLSLHLPDLGVVAKTRNFAKAMGYSGYISGREEDRKTLFVRDVYPLKRRSDGKKFGHSILTQSIGSGIESRLTVYNSAFNAQPISKGDIIRVIGWEREKGQYFTLRSYRVLRTDADSQADEFP